MSGTVLVTVERPVSSINCTNVSMGVPVAVKALATNSVDGQRARPSEVTRFDLLKVVGIESRLFCKTRGREPGDGSEAVQCSPDLSMSEHLAAQG